MSVKEFELLVMSMRIVLSSSQFYLKYSVIIFLLILT